MEWISLFISCITFLGGCYAYFRHDRIIKNQEKKLNDMQISRINKENEQEKMAEMKAVYRDTDRDGKIRFINAGKSDAYNVRVELLTPVTELQSCVAFDLPWGPYDVINPQSYRDEFFTLCMGCPDTISVKIIWDDEFGENRTVSLVVPLS